MSGRAARASKARKRESAAAWRQQFMAALLECASRMRSGIAPLAIDWSSRQEERWWGGTFRSFDIVTERAHDPQR